MSKKNKEKSRRQGTYALCITAGLILGVGLGPALGSVLLCAILGGLVGATVAYFINQRPAGKRH